MSYQLLFSSKQIKPVRGAPPAGCLRSTAHQRVAWALQAPNVPVAMRQTLHSRPAHRRCAQPRPVCVCLNVNETEAKRAVHTQPHVVARPRTRSNTHI